MTKQELRKVYLQKRLMLSDEEYEQMNARCCSSFFRSIRFDSLHVIHSFLPIKKNREPDTWRILDKIQREYPRIRLSLPRISPTGVIRSYYYSNPHELETNSWGIPEPKEGEATNHHDIDLVVVPLLAFDLHGQRVGYGKGYYDRFLKECRRDCQTVGLCFFPPEREIENLLPTDVSLDRVVTPEKTYTFS